MIIRRAAALLGVMLWAGPAVAADLHAPAGRHAALRDCVPASNYTFVAPEPVDLVVGPGHDYGRLAVIPPCTSLAVILCEYRTAWCKVRYGRYDGWVFDQSLRITAMRYPFGH